MKNLALACALVLLAGPLAAAGPVVPVNITLKKSVVITANRIMLADICESIDDQQLAQRDIEICATPEPGIRRLIPTRLVEIRLKQAHVREVTFTGPECVEIIRPSASVGDDLIRTELTAYLDSHKPEGVFNPEYRFIRLPGSVLVEPGTVRLEISEKNKKLNYWGANYFSVKIFVDDKPQKTVNVGVDIESMVEIAVTSRPVPRGKLIAADDISMVLRRYREIPKDAFGKLELMAGKRATHFIDKGFCLTPRDVEIPPVVSRGDQVTMVSRAGAIEIVVNGEAREDARLGEKIWVKNLQSGKMIQGIVTDYQTVRIGG